MADDSEKPTLADRRLAVMQGRIEQFRFSGGGADFPNAVHDVPLFRYDDETRGYCDGTVWKLGATGRPKAIITAELHPRYGGTPRIVYDFLSLNPGGFRMRYEGGGSWSPSNSALQFRAIKGAKLPATTPAKRLSQLKLLAGEFSATQLIEEELDHPVKVDLRLLPQPIDRYTPTETAAEKQDGAIFLFVNGRNPGIVLFVESNGKEWLFAAGRLSLPSTLKLYHSEQEVWSGEAGAGADNAWYTATNAPIQIPGADD
jgi:hypothetical protein